MGTCTKFIMRVKCKCVCAARKNVCVLFIFYVHGILYGMYFAGGCDLLCMVEVK